MSTYRERRLERASRLRDWAEKRAARSAGNFSKAHNLVKDIPLGQPILVGHHSERRHRRTLERSDAAMRRGLEDHQKGASMASRADTIEAAAESAIYRDDVDAIERLTAKLATLEAERAHIKAVNVAVRKHGLVAAAKLEPAVLTPADIKELLQLVRLCPYHQAETRGYPAYALTNLGGTITRERKRLAELTAAKTARGAAIVAADAATPLERAGLTITATMTTPAKAWKQPRPVWNVGGNLAHWRPALERLGGSWYRGVVSFFDDPTDLILDALQAADEAAS